MGDFGAIKASARQAVHNSLSLSALYSFKGSAAVELGVTHRDKNAKHGDNGGEYVDIVEGVDRLKFDQGELTAKGVTLQRAGLVEIPSEGFTYALDHEEPNLGSNRFVYWSVVRQL